MTGCEWIMQKKQNNFCALVLLDISLANCALWKLSYKQSSRTTESLSHALRPLKQTTTNFQVKLSLDPEMCFYDLKAEKSSKLEKKYQPKNQQATQGFPCKCFIYITPSLDFPHVWSEALTGRSADAISPLKAH